VSEKITRKRWDRQKMREYVRGKKEKHCGVGFETHRVNFGSKINITQIGTNRFKW
jgi:hypothetical protein